MDNNNVTLMAGELNYSKVVNNTQFVTRIYNGRTTNVTIPLATNGKMSLRT